MTRFFYFLKEKEKGKKSKRKKSAPLEGTVAEQELLDKR
jgi:hypothetical protein